MFDHLSAMDKQILITSIYCALNESMLYSDGDRPDWKEVEQRAWELIHELEKAIEAEVA